jgi:hypothetical protein
MFGNVRFGKRGGAKNDDITSDVKCLDAMSE